MKNPNHPKKGAVIKSEPIRSLKDIKLIKQVLADKPRDLALFITGINTNLRASDLTRLMVGQLKHLVPGDVIFSVREKKTSKEKHITMNQAVFDAVQAYLATRPNAEDDEPLFRSRKGGQFLKVTYVSGLVKKWCKDINLKGNYSAHTLRKTFGFIHRVHFNTGMAELVEMYNHSSERQTLAYLGLQREEIKDAYLKCI
jgi:integrase